MAKIYFSYSHSDSDLVQKLANKLVETGHEVFIDRNILPGTKWQNTLSKALREADVVIIIFSKESISSRWLMSETGAALGYFRERNKPKVIPIIIDDIDIPDIISDIQALFASRNEMNLLTNDLIRILDNLTGQLNAQEDERKEIQYKVKLTAAEYIEKSLTDLNQREKKYQRIAYSCYVFAFISLIGCIYFGIWRSTIIINLKMDIGTHIQFAILSILIISLIIALSRFAFIMGKSFMVEALRNSDRIHAIKFGEFYLNVFGEKAEWQQIKEAFQNWNIDKGSSFLTQNTSDYDPELLKNAIEIAKTIMGKK
jgi:hypothetical protein